MTLLVATLFVVACAGEEGVVEQAAPLEDRLQYAELAGSPLARFLPDGPLHGIVMAAGVDEDGAPLEPTVTFAPEVPEVTAIVALGAVGEGTTLTVEWRRIGAGIDELDSLFAHEIAVEPFHRAYSVGVSEGVLAPGMYEVTASLGEHDVSALWRVAGSGSGAAGGKEPPVAGESGTIGPHASPASGTQGSGDCGRLEVWATPLVLLVEYDVYAFSASGGIECPPARVVAAAGGPPALCAEHPPPFSDYLHPCDLPGGNDMPGTLVQLSAWWADNEAEVVRDELELVDPEEPPLIGFQSQPANGSRVKAGDTVRLRAEVIRLPPAKGLRWAELRSPDEVLARDEREATPCDLKRFGILLETTYTVPADPPPVIELTAVAEDHDGLEATETITLVTEETWEGTMRSEATQRGAGFECASSWKGAVEFTVDGDGAVSGGGRVDLVGTPRCSFELRGDLLTFFEFTIHGRRDDDRFTLQLELDDYNPGSDPGGWMGGHFVPLKKGTPEGEELVVPITKPGVINQQVSLPWSIPDSGGEVIDTFELTCKSCQEASD